MNDFFNAHDAIQNIETNKLETKEELIQDLESLFDEVEPTHNESLFGGPEGPHGAANPPEDEIDEIERDGQKMKEELKKAKQMISNGMD